MAELISCNLLEEMKMYWRLRALRQELIDPELEIKNPQETVEKSIRENSKEKITRKRIIKIKEKGPDLYIQIGELSIYRKIRKEYDTVAYVLGIPIAKIVRRNRIKKYYILGFPIKEREWTDTLQEQDLEDLKIQIMRLKQMKRRM